MFKLLLKKQFTDIFQSFFINKKNGEAKSKGKSAASIILFVLLLVFMMGAMFFPFAKTVCATLVAFNLDWLYFLIFFISALTLGTFGSVFNTFTTLYKAKDNDLLLSLPIPAKYIVLSRLTGVYLLGLMYSMLVFIPAQVVYFINKGFSFKYLASTVVFALIISLAVLCLSAVLGWVVAKISVRVKNKSIVTVVLSLVFIGLYYFFYFKASEIISNLLINAISVSEKIIGKAYVLYFIGCAAAGNILNLLVCTAVCLAGAFAAYYLITRSFFKMASTSDAVKKAKYREKTAKVRSPFWAFVAKEINHFSANPNYILNSGLGSILMPIAAIAVLIKGSAITGVIVSAFPEIKPFLLPIVAVLFCFMTSMNDLTAPSISLEGKNIWIAQSVPVQTDLVLTAKIVFHLLITEIPVIITVLCVSAAFGFTAAQTVVLLMFVCTFVVFQAISGLCVNLKSPNLTWTNETVAIKQSMSVMVAIFGSWGYAVLLGLIYYLVNAFISPIVYLLIAFALNAALSIILYRWIKTKGVKIFASL